MYKKIFEKFKSAGRIALLPHENIDGDTLSSCFALKYLIEKAGGNAMIVADGEVPSNLSFLGSDYVLYSDDIKLPEFDTAVAVDCASIDRFKKRAHIFKNAETKIVIDHHKTNSGFGDYCIVLPESAATCEIIYNFFVECDVELSLKAAECLYTGILTDTGGFRYSNTTERTFEIASKLVSTGIDFTGISVNIFESKPYAQLKIEAEAVENARFYHGGKTVVSYISEDMKKKAGATDSNLENISSLLREIDGVCTAVVIKEKDGALKISMRSKHTVNVAKICYEFGGGGHIRAAGATSCLNAEETEKRLVASIGEAYERDN